MAKTKRVRSPVRQVKPSAVDHVTGEIAATSADSDSKDPAAVALGRKGGLKGGAARASALSSAERSRIASHAAKVRWEKRN